MLVMQTMARVAVSKYLPGLLLKIGFRVRIARTMTEAEITDSRNQPVRNCSLVACITYKSTKNVLLSSLKALVKPENAEC
jgi:hypothetical protein